MENIRGRIILVDDIQSNLDQGRNILKPYYDVYPAPSAARLFAMLEKIMPDLILLDIEMPETDGYETIKILKSDERYKSIPVIFVTARDDESSEYKGLDLGAADYVSKPFSPPMLLKRIEKELLLVRQKEELKGIRDQMLAQHEKLLRRREELNNWVQQGEASLLEKEQLLRQRELDLDRRQAVVDEMFRRGK